MDAKFFRKNVDEDNFSIRIDRHGQWYHEGSPIARDKLAKLFSSVLHFDTDRNEYWLITPAEQGRIEVEDVPYIIVDFELSDNALTLTTNLGHIVTTDKDHVIECHAVTGLPYVHVNNNVKARLNRATRDKLIDLALDRDGYNKNTGELILNINDIRHVIAIDTELTNEG
jgi:hypothetical protein